MYTMNTTFDIWPTLKLESSKTITVEPRYKEVGYNKTLL